MHDPSPTSNPRFTAALVAGLALIGLGGVVLLNNMGIVQGHHALRYWPLVLVALGIQRMWAKGFLQAVGGHVLLLVGGMLQLAFLERDLWLDRFWPLAIVWVGLIMTLRALLPRRSARQPNPEALCQDDDGRPQ